MCSFVVAFAVLVMASKAESIVLYKSDAQKYVKTSWHVTI